MDNGITQTKSITWLTRIVFITLFMRVADYYGGGTLFSKMAILLSFAVAIGGVLNYLFNSCGEVNIRKSVGVNLFLFWMVTVLTTLFNYERQYIWYEVTGNLTFYFGIYCIASKAMHSPFSLKQLTNGFFIIEIIFTVMFLWYRFSGVKISDGAVNSVYFVVTLLPFALLNQNKSKLLIAVALIVLVALISNKRVAFLMVLIAVAVYFLLILLMNTMSFEKKVAFILLTVIAVGVVWNLYNSMAETMDVNLFERLETLQEDGGSGRDVIYAKVTEKIKKFTVKDWITGHGFSGVSATAGIKTSAHNDFLEVIYDYGIGGIILYVFLLLKVLRLTFQLRKKKPEVFIAGIVSMLMFLFMSMFSHLILYPTYVIYFVVFWSVISHEDNAY